MQLKGKHIILGITGGIAAYKSAYLCRLLIKEGAEVRVVMTPHSKAFITPLTMGTLSKNPVLSEFFQADNGKWNSHVDLGLWADLMIIAPATATTIGKMANGIADNLLITTYLSARCPVVLAPAMDLDMYKHLSTRNNIEKLIAYGNYIIAPPSGELASGLDGKGRMAEPNDILEKMIKIISSKKKLHNKVALVTAGPTYEKIDPVRFIGNFSTGKMGFAIAESLAEQGTKVFLITGPVSEKTQNPNIQRIDVVSAEEMYKESLKYFSNCDIAIMAAAVADYKVKDTSDKKIKREDKNISLNLIANKDIAASLGKIKTKKQLLVGFALETNNETENAQKKIQKKNLDFIVLNSLQDKGAGFGYDTNKISIIDKYNKKIEFELKSKKEVSLDIVNKIIEALN